MNNQTLIDSSSSTASTEPLITQQERLIDMPLIPRYNVFIRNYNLPTCIVNNIPLNPLPNSPLHSLIFSTLTNWKGKLILIILLLTPILNILMCLLTLYCLYVYCRCLGVHEENVKAVEDPFKNMVYDHDLCFKLRKDYYAFTIEFRELQGFSLNYNRDMRKELSLREERGKANFLIYNGNFWASYNHLGKWKNPHLMLVAFSGVLAVVVNVLFFSLLA